MLHLMVYCPFFNNLRNLVRAFLDINDCSLTPDMFFELSFDNKPLTPYFSLILAEYLYTIWKCHKDLAFNRKKLSDFSSLSFFKCRLRNRIKIDCLRLDKEVFQDYWLHKTLPVTLLNSELVFGF